VTVDPVGGPSALSAAQPAPRTPSPEPKPVEASAAVASASDTSGGPSPRTEALARFLGVPADQLHDALRTGVDTSRVLSGPGGYGPSTAAGGLDVDEYA
jgi:hypothetical protein